MTIFVFDGFELEKTSASFDGSGSHIGRYPLSTNIPTNMPIQEGRLGGLAYRSEDNQLLRFTIPEATEGNLLIGFGFRIGTMGDTAETSLCTVRNSGNVVTLSIDIRKDTGENGFRLRVTRYGQLAENNLEIIDLDRTLDFDTWFYFEIYAELFTDNDAVTFKINGDTEIVSADTGASGYRAGYQDIRLRPRTDTFASGYVDIDDLYVSDGTEGFLGPNTQASGMYPNGDIGTNEWIPSPADPDHYTLVDDAGEAIPDVDYDTTRLDSVADDERELFDTTKVANAQGKVHAVRVAVDARAVTTSERLDSLLVTSRSTAVDSNIPDLSNYIHFSEILQTDPATGDAWNIDQIKDLQVGFETPVAAATGNWTLEILLEDGISVGSIPLTLSDELPIRPPIQPNIWHVQGVVAGQLPILDPFGAPAWIILN